ncbi:MAG: hypothetical protein LBC45_00245 [Chlamydiales bacterium]|jgi:hypothetical protein|nr:hypothetical protein [Chlamydiales bacterium]
MITYEVIQDRVVRLNIWFDCCYTNLYKYTKGTVSHKNWLVLCLYAMQQIFVLEDQAKKAPKEKATR